MVRVLVTSLQTDWSVAFPTGGLPIVGAITQPLLTCDLHRVEDIGSKAAGPRDLLSQQTFFVASVLGL